MIVGWGQNGSHKLTCLILVTHKSVSVFNGVLMTVQCVSSRSTQIDGVGAQDTNVQYKGFFDRRIDWRGQKRSKTTGSCRTMDLNEHIDHF